MTFKFAFVIVFIAPENIYFCVYFVCKPLQFSSQQPTEKEHLSQIIMCTPVCAALGYLPQNEFDEEVARKDAEVYY